MKIQSYDSDLLEQNSDGTSQHTGTVQDCDVRECGESPLFNRPGFLIRRLHQIHTALFQSETESFGITPVQYSVMTTLADGQSRDQKTVAFEVGLERSSVADVILRLETRGLVRRVSSRMDRRVKIVRLTPKGQRLVKKMQPAVEQAHARTIEALPEPSRDAFLKSLAELVHANNAQATVPFMMPEKITEPES